VSALDSLLAQTLASEIKDNLGEATYERIQNRLIERYNLNIVDAIKDFQKLDATLREFFGPKADIIEKDFLEHTASLDTPKHGRPWVVIQDEDLSSLILESFADSEKRMILTMALNKPDILLNIIDRCGIPRSSGYRLVDELTKNGMLVEKGFTTTQDGKRVSQYTSLIENIRIDIMKGKLSVRIQLAEDILRESYLARIMQEFKIISKNA
jgi:hypothetical protein